MNPGDHAANWTSMVGSRRIPPAGELSRVLHRIAEVMEQECLSPRAAAMRMNLTAAQVRAEAHPSCDLSLSALYRWQTVLNVPVADMLREPDARLSPQVQFRGGLLKAMRTVRSLQDSAESEPIRALALQLAQQLTELMPELQQVSPWPTYGQRRRLDDYGAIVEKQISDDFFESATGE
jgi:hypothetical protein